MCKTLATYDELRPDHEELLRQGIAFEKLAIDLLNAIPRSADAEKILVMMPCVEVGAAKETRSLVSRPNPNPNPNATPNPNRYPNPKQVACERRRRGRRGWAA